ncbi:2073_t:CDS:2 [Rhizophagus irregularis]|nr:2073_t:CDS:2 [Rhizophagus irregularis]
MQKAIILVGGPSRGTRFRPLSLNIPKPLFPVAGHPIIWHHLEALSKIEGLKEVLLIGFYEDSIFQRFIDDSTREFPKINIRYFREYQSLGTAGGIYHFRDEIQRGDPKQIFVLNADVACSFPLEEMLEFHNTHKGLCTILGTKVAREAAKRYGYLVAKPEITSDDDKLRLEQDLLRSLAESKKLYVYVTTDFWRQIKTASSAVPANALYLEQYLKTNPDRLLKNEQGGPTIVGCVYKHPTAFVDPSAKIGPNVTIGPRVVVGKGVRIKDSIILDNVEIKANSCILHSVIGWDSKIGTWARVEGTPVTNEETVITQNGVKVQSITILANEVMVKDEIIIRNCIVLPHKELRSNCHNEVLM